MMRKRLRGDEDADGENGMGGIDGDDIKLNGGGKSNKSKSKDKELKITEMDEWMESSGDDSDDDDDDDKEKEDKEEKANKNKKTQKKKKIRDTDAEAFEDSDDGDDEGRELDYISSSSESDDDIEKQLQGNIYFTLKGRVFFSYIFLFNKQLISITYVSHQFIGYALITTCMNNEQLGILRYIESRAQRENPA